MSVRALLLLPFLLSVLLLGACQVTENRARVLRLREVVGTIEVASSSDEELRTTDTDRGIPVMSKGAMLRLPEGARVRLEFLDRRGYLYYYGPGELLVADTRLVRGKGGVHAEAQEIHATLQLHGGILAGAMEGSMEERPSIEVMTDNGATQLETTGKFAVMQLGDLSGEGWTEAWVRDERGPDELRILLDGGKSVLFPPNGVFMITAEDPPTPDAVETGSRDFTRAYLGALTVDPGPLPEESRLVEALIWKSESGF